MNLQGHKRSLSAFTNKKTSSGITKAQFINNIKPINIKNQIILSQSQKNIKTPLTPNKKVDIRTRPNTGGSKSTLKTTLQSTNKDRSRFNNRPNKNDMNISNLSVNNSRLTERKNDRGLSAIGMRVPNINFSKIKSSTGSKNSQNNGGLVGPKTSRDPVKNKMINNMRASKSNSRLNESSMNNSVNDAFKSITNRSNIKNLSSQRGTMTPHKNNKGLSYSKSPNQKANLSINKINNLKKPNPNMKLLNNMNFSKLNVIAGIPNESKKNSNEHFEVQVTNNMKQKIQPKIGGIAINKIKNFNKQTFINSANSPRIDELKNPKEELRENKFSNENLTKNLNFRAMNTSPLVRKHPEFKINKLTVTPSLNPEISIKKEEGKTSKILTKSSSEPKIEVVNEKITIENNASIIKSIKSMFDISKTGFAGPGQKKTNQDNFFIHKNFNNNPNSIFFGVCDGHGIVGHEASQYLRETLPNYLDNELKKKKSLIFNKVIIDSFIQVNNKLCNETIVDTHFSGSTCVTVIYTPEKLICANVGDSRAVLGRLVNGCWLSHDLSRDHKPSEKDECDRIISKKGRVEPFRDENGEFIGPPRVWLKEDDIPGLAMSRSFGDQVAASVGCIPEPEIKEWRFTKDDMFFILASDGIWEFIESDECVNIIKDFYLKDDIQGASEYLVKEATKRWMKEEEVIDDITLILVFFN